MPRRLRFESLENRATPSGTQVPAGEFNWLQATPAGGLAELLWDGNALVYRTRAGDGWTAETVAAQTGAPTQAVYAGRDQVQAASQAAQLAFTPDGTPHVFVLDRVEDPVTHFPLGGFDHYARRNGSWVRVEQVPVGPPGSGFLQTDLTAAVGPGGVFHVVVAQPTDSTSGKLWYATNKGGAWSAEVAATTGFIAGDVLSVGDRTAPRFLSVAADSGNFAHLTYTPEFRFEDFGTVFSQLGYATNRGGAWHTEVVYSPPDGTGDAGKGASIAIGPDDQPAIASTFVDRVPTGSPASAILLYHTRAGAGWSSQVVAGAPDGYAAADGPHYTGYSPLLQFDGVTPVITFSDYASEHLAGTGANEMSGQIRTATRTGGGWALQTVYRQTDPLVNEVYYPVRAVAGGQAAFAALRVTNTLGGDKNLTGAAFEPVFVGGSGGSGGSGGAAAVGAGVVGAGAGGGPVVAVYGADGGLRFQAFAFDPSFTGGVRVASGDFTRDGTDDVVAGTGPGVTTRVRVLDGATQAEVFAVSPFEATFTGGVFVAAGDLTGDGVPELIITPDEGGGPRVRVFDGRTFAVLADFLGIDDANFRGGARAAVADVNGDGVGDLLVAAGFGGGPRVAVFDGRSVGGGRTPARLVNDFFVFEQTLRNGVYIAGGDLNRDGFAEVVVGGGPGGGPRVFALSGKDLLGGTQTPVTNFFAGDPNTRGGVRVAVRDLDGDQVADILAGAGPGAGSRVTEYLGAEIGPSGAPAARDFEAFPGLPGGVFVG